MTRRINGKEAKRKLGVWLLLLLHCDAARRAPRAWLVALWWRVVGKKVRARARFALLFATSAYAYRAWLQTENKLDQNKQSGGPPIIALVGHGPGQDATLRCLMAQGVQAWPIGSTGDLTEAAAAIDWSAAPWLMPLSAGDLIAPNSIMAYRAAAATTCAAILYADDDLLDSRGQRSEGHFKPSWNSELYRHFDYITGACILRATRADFTGVSGFNWARHLVASTLRHGTPIHIPHVLHHRRTRPAPMLPVKAEPIQETLPKVTVIIPTRNRVDLLSKCIAGLERTNYPDIEIIVVDNCSDDPATLDYLASLNTSRARVLRDNEPFNFSALNNRAAQLSEGKLLCLLNNDIEMIDGDWLAIMARQALRPDVGAVGARLLYPDGRIQHAGVVTGICGGACHAHRLLFPDEEGYFHRHSLPQFVSAVTAACLVVQRQRFEAVGGLDEANFAVAFNDVDLCLKLNVLGWQSFYEPRATLIHHESVSRGFDRDPIGAARLAAELAMLRKRWDVADMNTRVDPYHHPQLSRYSERFVARIEDLIQHR